MSESESKPKRKNDMKKDAFALLKLMAISGFAIAGATLLDWVTLVDRGRTVLGWVLIAIATALTFLWFRHDKIKF